MSENTKLILSIDDDERLGLAIKMQIQATGRYTCIHVTNSRDAAETLRHNKVDAILLDHNLKDETAFDVLMMLKDLRQPLSDTPIVLYSSYPVHQLAHHFSDHCNLVGAVNKYDDAHGTNVEVLDRLFLDGGMEKERAKMVEIANAWENGGETEAQSVWEKLKGFF